MNSGNVRVLDAAEAAFVLEKAKSLYQYDRSKRRYWYPLNVYDLPYNEENTLFIDESIMEPKLDEIKKLYDVDSGIYCILAYWMKADYVLEISDLDFRYMRSICMEYFCMAKDFASVLYVSHEGTVAFVGEKLDAARKILAPL